MASKRSQIKKNDIFYASIYIKVKMKIYSDKKQFSGYWGDGGQGEGGLRKFGGVVDMCIILIEVIVS